MDIQLSVEYLSQRLDEFRTQAPDLIDVVRIDGAFRGPRLQSLETVFDAGESLIRIVAHEAEARQG